MKGKPMPGLSKKEVDRVLRHIEPQGVGITAVKNGVMLRLPDGSSTVVHYSGSDHRGPQNLRATLRKAGVSWPTDPHDIKLPNYVTQHGITEKTRQRTLAAFDALGKPDGVTTSEMIEALGMSPAGYGNVMRYMYHSGLRPDGKRKGARLWSIPYDERPDAIVTDITPAPEPEPEPAPPVLAIAPEPEPEPEPRPAADPGDWWTVDLDMLADDMTVWQLRTLYQASGLDIELRLRKS